MNKKIIHIIPGTTPTIRFMLRQTNPADIAESFLTVRSAETTVTKGFADMETGEDYIQWKLDQAETLGLTGATSLQANYMLTDGTRGASMVADVIVDEQLRPEVIVRE